MLSERMVRLTRRLMNVLFPSGWDNIQFDAVHEALRTAAREAAIAENEARALVCRTVANGADAAKAAGASGMSIKQVRWTAEDLEKAIRARREGL